MCNGKGLFPARRIRAVAVAVCRILCVACVFYGCCDAVSSEEQMEKSRWTDLVRRGSVKTNITVNDVGILTGDGVEFGLLGIGTEKGHGQEIAAFINQYLTSCADGFLVGNSDYPVFDAGGRPLVWLIRKRDWKSLNCELVHEGMANVDFAGTRDYSFKMWGDKGGPAEVDWKRKLESAKNGGAYYVKGKKTPYFVPSKQEVQEELKRSFTPERLRLYCVPETRRIPDRIQGYRLGREDAMDGVLYQGLVDDVGCVRWASGGRDNREHTTMIWVSNPTNEVLGWDMDIFNTFTLSEIELKDEDFEIARVWKSIERAFDLYEEQHRKELLEENTAEVKAFKALRDCVMATVIRNRSIKSADSSARKVFAADLGNGEQLHVLTADIGADGKIAKLYLDGKPDTLLNRVYVEFIQNYSVWLAERYCGSTNSDGKSSQETNGF